MSETTRKRIWFAYFSAVLALALNAYFFLGQLAAAGELFALRIQGRPYISDFVNVYLAGNLARRCLSGAPGRIDIYDPKVQGKLQRELVAPVVPEQTFYCQYPPLMFVFFLPLSALDMFLAWLVWSITGVILAMATLKVTVFSSVEGAFARVTAALALLGSYPSWFSIRIGQTSLAIFPAIGFFWRLLREDRVVSAAAVSVVVAMKLQYLPVIMAVGAARGGWRYLSGFTLSAAVVATICAVVVGPENMMRFPQALAAGEVSAATIGVAPDKMQNLRGLLVLLTGSDSRFVHIISAGAMLSLALSAFLIWRRTRLDSPTRFDLLAAATTLLMLFLSPHTHIQDYMLALLPCAWFFTAAARDGSGLAPHDRLILKAIAVSFPILSWILYVTLPFFQMLKVQPFALWSLAVSVYAATVYVRLPGSNAVAGDT